MPIAPATPFAPTAAPRGLARPRSWRSTLERAAEYRPRPRAGQARLAGPRSTRASRGV